jgi:hypothetical protein
MDWIEELKGICEDLQWKNITEIHSKELEFFIDETTWAIQLLEEYEDVETKINSFWWKQAHVMSHLLKIYIRRNKINLK